MKKIYIVLAVFSSILLASGAHSGGHGEKKSNTMHHGESSSSGHDSHWNAPKKEANKKNPIHSSSKSIKIGKDLFTQNCASCHGADAMGGGSMAKSLKTKPTDLMAMAGGHSDGDFAWKIKTGKGDMPSWNVLLEEEEIWHLVNYIQSLEDAHKGH